MAAKRQVKPVHLLQVSDLQANPVWQFVGNDLPNETYVRPVTRIPVGKLMGKIVGTQVLLANGARVWALIANIQPDNPRFTEHFVNLSFERNSQWFHLARYHDFDYVEHGPGALAEFLGLRVEDVFPVSYDIRPYASGDPSALAGKVWKDPQERLSRAEIIAMAVP